LPQSALIQVVNACWTTWWTASKSMACFGEPSCCTANERQLFGQ
jgi:hypothetical protein